MGARASLVREEEWAQETQRSINDEGAVSIRAPARHNKLYLVTVSKSWGGLHAHLVDHALLQACVDELERAGYSSKLPNGAAVFTDAENYKAAIAAAGDLKPCHVLITKPYKKATEQQVKTAPRVNIRGMRLLANFFGPGGAELRTASNPSDFDHVN